MVWNHSQARCKATQQYIDNNKELHVHVINKRHKTRRKISCSLTQFKGFQHHGVVRNLDVMLQGYPCVSKSHNYKVPTCPTKNSMYLYPHKFLKHMIRHLKKSHRSCRSSIERFSIAIEGVGLVVHGAEFITKTNNYSFILHNWSVRSMKSISSPRCRWYFYKYHLHKFIILRQKLYYI